MNIYFAINEKIIQERGMPERFQESNTFKWELSHNTILASIIADSAGKVLDIVNQWVDTPYAICKAHINDIDMIEVLRAAVVGDVVRAKVIVSEITWIK